MSASDSPASDANPDTDPTAAAAGAADADDIRRRFREALERKHGNDPHGSSGHNSAKGPAPQSNEKRQRSFRRKSG